jgi:beta-carotene 15,15'-dioxygenase
MTLLRRAPRPLLGAAVVGIAAALMVLDRVHPWGGLIVLLVLVGSLGMVHGAMDALLLVQQFRATRTRITLGLVYLSATIATAWALWLLPGIALMLLLALSIWHFGEGFDHFRRLPAAQQAVYRFIRGGAPVLLPALMARPALQPLVGAAVAGDTSVMAIAWAGWSALALAWLGGVCVWLAWSHPSPAADRVSRRRALVEIVALTALYALVSPLMAFALYFGLYHAAGHIRRVLAVLPAGVGRPSHRDPYLVTALALTGVLGVLLAAAMQAQAIGVALPDLALRTMILALVAVSVPHVVLISFWAAALGPVNATGGLAPGRHRPQS